ncbi:MAG: succinyldiaminopimelate transaminase [Burkholderiales bacterium]|nr:succinyldiaminopimelate transaminase [Burkholderiales bacterium]
MNPHLAKLQPYPFERLRKLFEGLVPAQGKKPIALSIGEPKHPTPPLVQQALIEGLARLANYPTTPGMLPLREAIAQWIARRHGVPAPDPATQILPVAGSREALFAFAQAVVTGSRPDPVVVMPNPCYQIYEGGALLAGAEPAYLNSLPANGFEPDYAQLPDDVWRRTVLLFACSPDNPTGRVMSFEDWKRLFELSDRHGFIIAADECYSEIYFDEARPPLGALAAARMLGRDDYRNLVVFGSLSKRSNVPGMRSGFVAGDARLIKTFLLYRTYHGTAMSDVVALASIAAWNDEAHVVANRALYAGKFRRLQPLVNAALPCAYPEAAFYLWAKTPIPDQDLARRLYVEQGVTVLPGSFIGRISNQVNPGENFIRIALVDSLDECSDAVSRIVETVRTL